jgi:outer membrane protein OmpA-like peptidoglycan-associated protein
MFKKSLFLVVLLFVSSIVFSQAPLERVSFSSDITSAEALGSNGFLFETLDAGINTKFSEYASGFFRNKFIMVSSKKIGGLAKMDPNTGEAYKNIFCLDIEEDGTLKKPLLFSRLINTSENNEYQISFSPDEHTMYYTRSKTSDVSNYELYKTTLEVNSSGNWIEQEKLAINLDGYSIENPFVSSNGKQLYFSSNRPGTYGGFDIFVSDILEDGTLSNPENLGKMINTSEDEQFPTMSKNSEYLYFASKGHVNFGGFDLFRTTVSKLDVATPRNLGNTINSKYDEMAMYFASNTKGYMTSNKSFGKGAYDIFKFEVEEILQSLEGKVLDLVTQLPLPNATLQLKDENGIVLDEIVTGNDAKYNFTIKPFDDYTITVVKDGFEDKDFNFKSIKGDDRSYRKNILLDATKAEIVEVEDRKLIKVENIFFDFNKANIKSESTITLNKIYDVLVENPEMSININAHSDNRGKASYNLVLSRKRAASAKAYLINKGIAKSRIASQGFGESQPLIDCKSNCTEEEYKQNRRIEFVINQ